MNVKYKGIGRKSVAGLLLCLMGVLTACEDDFGKNGTNSGVLTMKVTVPEGWTSGVAVDEEAPDSRCVSVDAAASESSIPLYLHTIESDNTVAVPSTRGALKESVTNFSMSAICYEEEGDIPRLTPNFAYDLTCTVGSDGTVSCPKYLQWPANGKVRFFAFALLDDSSKPFDLSGKKGAPIITYTVPNEVDKQHDLMAACTDATSANVTLNFRHILTAVKVVTAKDMIPGKITKVKFSGIPNRGIYTPSTDAAQDKWEIVGTSTGTYTVEWEEGVAIDGGYKGPEANKEDIVGTGGGGKELIGATDNLTLLMIPQTLPEGATLTVTFEEALSGKEFTLSADLGGKEWPAGKILTYSISPSSIHIKPVVEFNKVAPAADGSTDGDELPYSGVWTDVEMKAYAAVTRQGETGVEYVELPRPIVKYTGAIKGTAAFYDSNGKDIATVATDIATAYTSPQEIHSHKGMLVFTPQTNFTTLQAKFGAAVNVFEDTPVDLFNVNGNESANTYMVGKPGYYKFPVVYGNSCKGGLNGGNTSAYTIKQNTDTPGMLHYVDYQGSAINSNNYKPASVADAKLAWQDSPDLIDDVTLSDSPDANDVYWVTFRVSKHTINQGNALIVVRDDKGDIIWSWQIWVTQHTDEWMERDTKKCSHLKSIHKTDSDYTKLTGLNFTGHNYYLTGCNLGYCDPHPTTDAAREFKMSFEVTVGESPVTLTTYEYDGKTYNISNIDFLQAEFKGSKAGDNTYYQWGRKDPMLGGIYNDKTPVYYFTSTPTDDYSELNMENKPTFNVYNENGVSYEFTRNKPGTSITDFGEEKGVDIMWTIKNPYKFVMSKYDEKINNTMLNYRDHWHQFISEEQPSYVSENTAALFQMWNAQASKLTNDTKVAANLVGTMAEECPVTKSVYDPCPAGYHVPPAAAFTALAYYGEYYRDSRYGEATEVDGASYSTSVTWDASNHTWTVAYPGGEISFPATGVRNKSPRYATYGDITLDAVASRADFSDNSSLGDLTLPAFRMLTYLAGTSMGQTRTNVNVFYIDKRLSGSENSDKSANSLIVPDSGPVTPAIGSIRPSADSYGLSVRPALDIPPKS